MENKKSKQCHFTYNDINIAISIKHALEPPDLLMQWDSQLFKDLLEWVMMVGIRFWLSNRDMHDL